MCVCACPYSDIVVKFVVVFVAMMHSGHTSAVDPTERVLKGLSTMSGMILFVFPSSEIYPLV